MGIIFSRCLHSNTSSAMPRHAVAKIARNVRQTNTLTSETEMTSHKTQNELSKEQLETCPIAAIPLMHYCNNSKKFFVNTSDKLYTQYTNPKSEVLYETSNTAFVNTVECTAGDNYKVKMYNSPQVTSQSPIEHNSSEDGIHRMVAPQIATKIYRSGSVEFTLSNSQGNDTKQIHKNRKNEWN